ncbi:MAG TPA: phage tail sheath subtilisin-like domain-containing protein [Actinopolymorphaceae bacterium]|jgi:phage tail sheath protein FI
MPTYRTPGVYVEEVASGTRPIEAQGTSVPAFVGAGGRSDAPIGVPTAIEDWSRFARVFLGDGPMTPLAHAVNGFFQNAGSRCYVLDVGPDGTLSGSARRPGLSALEEIDDIAMVAAPGFTDPASYEAVLLHCEKLRDRVAILDAPLEVDDVMQLTVVGTATTSSPAGVARPAVDHSDPAGAGGPAGSSSSPPAAEAGAGSVRSQGLAPRSSSYGSFYFPWLTVTDLNTGQLVAAPPSGHIAGIWARTDSTRGVFKAPANEVVRGAVGLQYRVTPSEQAELNSAGVNAIRFFTSQGIRVWGARTIARDSEPEWKYLNLRRLFCMVEDSISRGTSWIVFEPNDEPLWAMIRRDISAFLTLLWRDGALVGRTAAEAFFVKCDRESNPPEVVDAGQVITYIGLAGVKPAEFIVFKISQFAGDATQSEGSSSV